MSARKVCCVLLILAGSAACEQPFDRTPAGYVDACYGGRASATKNWVCSNSRLVINVHGTEADWPLLARVVSEFGRDRALQVFDTSSTIPGYIRSLEISACSADGLFLLIDKRIYTNEELNQDGDRIRAQMFTYKGSFNWKPLAAELVSDFRKKWKGSMEVIWPGSCAVV